MTQLLRATVSLEKSAAPGEQEKSHAAFKRSDIATVHSLVCNEEDEDFRK